jgi:hypothetical protein
MWVRSAPVPSSGIAGGDLFVRQTSFTVPAGYYSPQGLAERVTAATNIISTTNGSGGQLASPFSILVNGNSDTGKFWLENSEAGGILGGRLDFHYNGGAFNLALLGSPYGLVMRWDDAIGRMELAYSHLPMLGPDGSEVTKRVPTYSNGTQINDAYTFFGDRSGVVLVDTGFGRPGQPPWQSNNNIFNVLGFSYEQLLLPGGWQEIQDSGRQPSACPSFTSTLTNTNLMPTTSDSPGSRAGALSSPLDFVASLGQRGRQAISGPRNFGTDSPVILVEVDVLPAPTLLCGDGRRRRILAYITKELESGGFIYTSLSAEAVFPRTTTISSITVRLLDSSKDFTEVQGLGFASELFLDFQMAEVPEASVATKKRRHRRRKAPPS